MTLSSGIDLKSIYRPPSTLQLPGGGPGLELNESAFSQPESMSSSSSQSSIGSSHGIQTELAAESETVAPQPRNISEVWDNETCSNLFLYYFNGFINEQDKTDDVFNASDSDTVVPNASQESTTNRNLSLDSVPALENEITPSKIVCFCNRHFHVTTIKTSVLFVFLHF